MAVATLRRSASIWKREAVVWRHLYRTSILLNFGQPLMWLLAFGLALGSYVYLGRPGNYLAFVGPGLLAITAMNVVTFDAMFGSWIKAHEWGVYDAVATTPVSPREVVLGNFAWESTRAVMYGGVFMLVMALLGLFHSWWALLLPLVLASVGPLFSAPAMAWAILCKRSFHHLFYYTELVVSPMFFFSGAFFPVDRLPGYLQALIWVTPLYHVVTLARALSYGALSWGLLVDAAYIAAVTLVLAPIAVRLLNRQLTS